MRTMHGYQEFFGPYDVRYCFDGKYWRYIVWKEGECEGRSDIFTSFVQARKMAHDVLRRHLNKDESFLNGIKV